MQRHVYGLHDYTMVGQYYLDLGSTTSDNDDDGDDKTIDRVKHS